MPTRPWTPHISSKSRECAELGVTLVEQPLAGRQDEALARIGSRWRSAPTKAVHDRASLAGLRER